MSTGNVIHIYKLGNLLDLQYKNSLDLLFSGMPETNINKILYVSSHIIRITGYDKSTKTFKIQIGTLSSDKILTWTDGILTNNGFNYNKLNIPITSQYVELHDVITQETKLHLFSKPTTTITHMIQYNKSGGKRRRYRKSRKPLHKKPRRNTTFRNKRR